MTARTAPNIERLADIGITPSIGRVGSSYDNALVEAVIGLYLEAVEFATLDWGDWFNHQRLLGSIGDIPPAKIEAESNFYDTLTESAKAA